MATKFWDKIGYNSVYMGDIRAIFAYARVIRVGLLNDARQILP